MSGLNSEQLRSEVDGNDPLKAFGSLLFGLICCGHIAVVMLSTAALRDDRSGWFVVAFAVAVAQIGLTAVCAALSSWPFVLRVPAWATIGTVPLATMWVSGVYAGAGEMSRMLAIFASSWMATVLVLTAIRWLPSVRWRLAHDSGARCDRPQGDNRFTLLQLFTIVAAIAVALSLVLQLLPPSWNDLGDVLSRQALASSMDLIAYIVAATVTAVVHAFVGMLMFGARRWSVRVGLGFCGITVAVLSGISDSLNGLLVSGIWLASFVVTLLAARSLGIRLIRECHATKRASGTPVPRTRRQRLICSFRNPATIALLAIASLYLWLDQTGTLMACRFLLTGHADQDARGSIVRLDFSDVPTEKLRLDGVGSFRQVTELNLRRSGVSDDELRHISDLTRPEKLYLNTTRVTNDGLKHLKGLTRLEVLDLGSTEITDDGLKHLKNMTELRTLYVCDTAIGDAGLQHLHAQRKLEDLSLGGTRTTLAGIWKLAQHLNSLRYVCGDGFLWADDTFHVTGSFSPEEMRLLGELHVRELWFRKAHLTQDACKLLADLCSVQEIVLSEVKGTDVAVKHMENMPRLRSLVLVGETTDDSAMKHVAKLRRLEGLAICRTAVSVTGFQRLSCLTDLCDLQLAGSNVTDDVLPAICGLAKLERLMLEDTRVRDVSPLATLSQLKELSILGTPVPREKIKKLREALPDCVLEIH